MVIRILWDLLWSTTRKLHWSTTYFLSKRKQMKTSVPFAREALGTHPWLHLRVFFFLLLNRSKQDWWIEEGFPPPLLFDCVRRKSEKRLDGSYHWMRFLLPAQSTGNTMKTTAAGKTSSWANWEIESFPSRQWSCGASQDSGSWFRNFVFIP